MNKLKRAITYYLDSNDSFAGRMLDLILTLLNLIACGMVVIESFYFSETQWPEILKIAESTIITLFLTEYILRLYSSEKKVKYIFSFYGIIDLLSILPSLFSNSAFAFLRALKVLRILRFLRFLENETFFFGKISKIQLQALKTIFTVFTILFVFSGFILFAERHSGLQNIQIKKFSDAFYYVVTTLSTVGFGDFVTVSSGGKMFTVIMILSGAILIPWQAGRLIQMLLYIESGKTDVVCGKCGLRWHDRDASHCKACGSIIFQEYNGNS
jgi:voltage-gated potassium channel